MLDGFIIAVRAAFDRHLADEPLLTKRMQVIVNRGKRDFRIGLLEAQKDLLSSEMIV